MKKPKPAAIEAKFQYSNQLAAKRDEMMRHSAELEEAAARIDGEAAVLENDITHRTERVERLKADIEEYKISGDLIKRVIEQKQQEIGGKRETLEEKSTLADQLREQLEALRTDDSEFNEQISGLMSRRTEITGGISAAQVEMASAQSQMNEISARMENVDSEIERRQSDIEKLTESQKLTKEAIQGASDRIAELDEDNRQLGDKLQLLRQQGAQVKHDSENEELDAKGHERKARIL